MCINIQHVQIMFNFLTFFKVNKSTKVLKIFENNLLLGNVEQIKCLNLILFLH